MADKVIVTKSKLDALATSIASKSGESSPMTIAQMKTAVDNIQGGTITQDENDYLVFAENGGYSGGSISDGVEILERNATGFTTKARLYGSGPVYAYQFACGNSNGRNSIGPWQALAEIEVAYKPSSIETLAFVGLNTLTSFTCDTSEVLSLGQNAFRLVTGIGAMTFPKVTTMGSDVFMGSSITSASFPVFNGQVPNEAFRSCSNLASVSFPRATKIGVYTSLVFKDCTALATAEFGSVGYPIIGIMNDAFSGCTQSGLTITVYTTGSYVSTLLANIRNGASNATIIIKASEATTYNGTSYAAGDTIVTSTPSE